MAIKKIGDPGREITLLQYGFADKSIAGVHYASQSAFPK